MHSAQFSLSQHYNELPFLYVLLSSRSACLLQTCGTRTMSSLLLLEMICTEPLREPLTFRRVVIVEQSLSSSERTLTYERTIQACMQGGYELVCSILAPILGSPSRA